MSDGRTGEAPDGVPAVEPGVDAPVDAREVASAGRSCLVIIVLAGAVLVVLCVGIAVRWAMT